MTTTQLTRLLGLGSLFFAGWGLLRPDSLGAMMGFDRDGARQVGVRELVIAGGLLARPGPATLAMRATADLSDAVAVRHHSRGVSAGSVGFATIALATAAAWRRRRT